MEQEEFRALIGELTREIAGRRLDESWAADLNARYAPDSTQYRKIFQACRAAIERGWMCNREDGGIKYGRVIKPGPETHRFSVDVVDMGDLAGPHHVHPNGEIDLVMPIDPTATFDGKGAGWVVYEPGSAHRPTVQGGRALVLYLLPEGAIQFSRT